MQSPELTGRKRISPSDPSKITSAGLFLYRSVKPAFLWHNRLFPKSVMTGKTTHEGKIFNISDRSDIRSWAQRWSHVLSRIATLSQTARQSKDLNMTLLTVSQNFPKIKQSELLLRNFRRSFWGNADNEMTQQITISKSDVTFTGNFWHACKSMSHFILN